MAKPRPHHVALDFLETDHIGTEIRNRRLEPTMVGEPTVRAPMAGIEGRDGDQGQIFTLR